MLLPQLDPTGGILIIPDIHQDSQWVHRILSTAKPFRKIILLGDYFDTKEGHPLHSIITTLIELKQTYGANIIMLMGNHDLPYTQYAYAARGKDYTSRKPNDRASGYTSNQAQKIHKNLGYDFLKTLKPFHWEEDILFTHAGLSPHWIAHLIYHDNLKQAINQFLQDTLQGGAIQPSPLLRESGYRRYHTEGTPYRPDTYTGENKAGGILWQDFTDFEEIPGIRQIIGHTTHTEPQITTQGSIALDTHQRHYALLQNGIISIYTA